jgi:hypothetical protein
MARLYPSLPFSSLADHPNLRLLLLVFLKKVEQRGRRYVSL